MTGRAETDPGALHPLRRLHEPRPPGRLYWTAHALPRLIWPLFGGLRADGVEHVPAAGPFLLLSNHQSVLDPFFIQSACRRPLHAMAKSTPFASPLVGFIMRRCYAFPVRRYRVDPQAVRIVLRRLALGHPVHIYVEGERTWDGGLQPPRRGSVRIALKAGVPIVPCAIDGAYDVWPRWHHLPRRGDIRVAFGPPFRLPRLDRRADREAALPEATTRIRDAIGGLLHNARASAAADE
jgi:1-acyl-sn-glycerol-3-phosphate acyltransferase